MHMIGNYAFETGTCYRKPAESQPRVLMPTLAILEKQPEDGSWKRCLELRMNRTAENWTSQTPSHVLQLSKRYDEIPSSMSFRVENFSGNDADKADILQLADMERRFHTFFSSQRTKTVARMYTDNALLYESEGNWRTVEEQVISQVMSDRNRAILVGIDCEVLTENKNAGMAYVVNKFHWQSTGDQADDFYSKGFHVWQLQPDGQWKVLIDINNTAPPENR